MLMSRQLVAILLLGLSAAVHICDAIPKLNLIGRAFKLNWQCELERMDTSAGPRLVDVEELHSGQQRRSILRYLRQGADSTRSTFYSSDAQMIMVKRGAFECQSVWHNYLDEFHRGIPEAFFDAGHSYLIGAGKMLALVAKQAAKFEREASPGYFKLFKGSFKSRGCEFKILLYYDGDSSGGSSKELFSTVPQLMQVVVHSDQPWHITYNLTQIQLLDEGLQTTASAAAHSDQFGAHEPTNEVVYDLFAFKQAIGCAHLSDDLPENLRQKMTDKRGCRFSFETELRGGGATVAEQGAMQRASVIYEPSLSSLLVHQIGHRGGTSNSVYNFDSNLRFHATRRHREEDTLDMSISEAGRQPESSCVVTLIKDSPAVQLGGNPFSLGRLLLGTEKLHYVGLARVRGIEARVYQWHGSDWPIWLQPPSVYDRREDSKNKTNSDTYYWPDSPTLLWRDNLEAMRKAGVAMSSVFYFSKTGPIEEEIFDSRLLLVEVLIIGQDNQRDQPRRYSFPIYDFTWNLPNSAPDGVSYEHAFSFRDDCLANEASISIGQLELKLEVSAGDRKDLLWLRDRAKRNVAILKLLQERFMFAPVSMIEDIQSRLIATSNTSALVPAVMRATTRGEKVTRLSFLCRLAKPSRDIFDPLPVINFDACLMGLAHASRNSVFAYEEEICYRLRPELEASGNSLDRLIDSACRFGDQQTGGVEMYQIVSRAEKWRSFDSLQNAARRRDRAEELLIGDPSDKSAAQVKVKSTIAVTPLANSKTEHEPADASLHDANKLFLGFGLVETDAQNKLVQPTSELSMSFEACQTACIGHFGCRSFSVCTSGGQMRCVLSTISFRAASMVRQLVELAGKRKRPKLGERFALSVDPDEQMDIARGEPEATLTIQVVEHPNCELHNKIYSDYFQHDLSKIKYSAGKPLFRPVTGMEQCAELCLEKTLAFLRDISRMEANSDKLIANRHQLIKEGLCRAINYVTKEDFKLDGEDQERLDPRRLDLKIEFAEILKELARKNHSDEVGGFCVLEHYDDKDNSRPGESEIHVSHDALGKIWFTTFRFDYLKLFEAKPGVSLVESGMTHSERKELESRIKLAVERGEPVESPRENLGWTEADKEGPRYCAYDCLYSAQRGPLGCRSFEFVEIDSPTGRTRKFCTFNTVTLSSSLAANRSDLVKYGQSEQRRLKVEPADKVRIVHFEPRAGLFSESLDKLYRISSARANREPLGGQTGPEISRAALFSVIMVLLVLGLTVGFALGAKLVRVRAPDKANSLIDGIFLDEHQPVWSGQLYER